MDDILARYRDCEVDIHYLTKDMFSDRGVLTDSGERWLQLTKNPGGRNAETLLVPVSAVRIVKIIARADAEQDVLLRPADGEGP